MRLPRKGILIRIVVYGGLLSYFGWQALNHYFDEKEAEEGATAVESSGVPSRQYKLPDGRSVEVLEITPEQAEQMYGVSPSVMPGEAEGGSAAKPATEDAAGAPGTATAEEAPTQPPGSAEAKTEGTPEAPEAAPAAAPAPAD